MNLHWHKHIHLFVKMVKKQHKSESLKKNFYKVNYNIKACVPSYQPVGHKNSARDMLDR